MLRQLSTLLLSMAVSNSYAGVYKCLDENGIASFSTNPYCSQVQPGQEMMKVEIRKDSILNFTDTAPEKLIFIERKNAPLGDVLSQIGQLLGTKIVLMGSADTKLSVSHLNEPWKPLFDELVSQYDLDFREAFGTLFVYQRGSDNEVIVNSPNLLRWYQSKSDWEVVQLHDRLLQSSQTYKDTSLEEREHQLIKRVKDALGETKSLNQGKHVDTEPQSGGISGDIAKTGSTEQKKKQDENFRKQIERTRNAWKIP